MKWHNADLERPDKDCTTLVLYGNPYGTLALRVLSYGVNENAWTDYDWKYCPDVCYWMTIDEPPKCHITNEDEFKEIFGRYPYEDEADAMEDWLYEEWKGPDKMKWISIDDHVPNVGELILMRTGDEMSVGWRDFDGTYTRARGYSLEEPEEWCYVDDALRYISDAVRRIGDCYRAEVQR